jgi:glycerophosphoryl diester phosphodiesterase
MTRPLLLGHRGARACKSLPENTLASFDRALADGCDGFEFDVRFTADQKAVVCHDPKIGFAEIASTPAEQLRQLPLLEDVLARYPSAFLDIELKVAGRERVVVNMLRSGRPLRFVLSSFLPEVLQALHAADPTLPLGLICETKTQLRSWRKLPVQYVIPQYDLVNRDLIREWRSSEKKVLVWTVNSPATVRRFAGLGVDGIISDDPKLLVETLG